MFYKTLFLKFYKTSKHSVHSSLPPFRFTIFSVAEGRSRTSTTGFGYQGSHELPRRHCNISRNRARRRNDIYNPSRNQALCQKIDSILLYISRDSRGFLLPREAAMADNAHRAGVDATRISRLYCTHNKLHINRLAMSQLILLVSCEARAERQRSTFIATGHVR